MARKWIEPLLHFAFWLFCFWVLYTAFSFESMEVTVENGVERTLYSRDTGSVPFVLFTLVVKMLVFYTVAFFLLPRFLRRRQWTSLLVLIVALFTGCFLFEYYVQPLLTGHYFRSTLSIGILLYLFILLAATAYRLAKDWWRHERLRAQLAEEKLSAELNYLKAQVNPHFLFNTLNNLYALAEREGSETLAGGIADLSGLLRYVIYDCRADYVLLDKEMQFLQNMVDMQRLRLDEEDEVLIALNISGPYNNKRIAPLLLAPFVENAFKHGIRYGQSALVKIDFAVAGSVLHFKVSNTNFSMDANQRAEKTGVGLENVRRRLSLLYPGRHQLVLEDKKDTFTAQLQLELDES